jgi:KDO2-lipid IV(A) lauroyltransferase
LLAAHFSSLGIAVCETALAWYASDEKVRPLARIDGAEHLQAALARGKGVILLAAHFTTLEIGARFCNLQWPLNIVYRPSKNAVLSEFLGRCRDRQAKRAIRRDDIRSMVSALRANEIVWFAPDQSYRKKGAQMVPFFGVPAATNPATSRLARMTGAAVLPYFVERHPRCGGYTVRIDAPLQDFPGEDPAADALRVHHLIEAQVRRVPEQYLWIHRRFKSVNALDPDRYA